MLGVGQDEGGLWVARVGRETARVALQNHPPNVI